MSGIGGKGRTGLRGISLQQQARAGEVGGAVQPVESELMSQILEALKTGGVGAQLPIVQQAVEGSRQATSRALQQSQESLFRSGLQGSPFGESILARTRITGEQQARRIPTQIAQSFIEMAPGLVQGLRATQAGLLSGAGVSKAQQKGVELAKEQQLNQLIGGIVGGLTSPGGGKGK